MKKLLYYLPEYFLFFTATGSFVSRLSTFFPPHVRLSRVVAGKRFCKLYVQSLDDAIQRKATFYTASCFTLTSGGTGTCDKAPLAQVNAYYGR